MTTLLLIIIYISFISLGLPDTLLGSSWPVMQAEFGVPLSYAGIVSMIVCFGTIISSFFSGVLIRRLGTGKVMAFSVLMTAIALFGTAFTPNFLFLCILGIPLGIGAGAVDAALNHFVAMHYKARHMSWLHCFWGIGASGGPIILSFFIARENGWKWGYGTIGLLQVFLVAILFITLPLWKKVENKEVEFTHSNEPLEETEHKELLPLSKKELFQKKGVKSTLITFFSYCAVEVTVGLWGSTYFVFIKGISPGEAAKWISLYYIGITVGRFISGFLTVKLSNRSLIRLGQGISAFGILLMFLPFSHSITILGLVLTGLGFAPIYPSLIHETPNRFGRAVSQEMMGIQMGVAYMGNTFVPPLFGVLAQYISIGLYPGFLLVFMALMVIASESMERK